MVEPLDRSRGDSTLFQFTTRRLRDFIDPNRLLIRIDEQLDFAQPVEPLEDCYCPDFGRPAIHPKVMVRARWSARCTTSRPSEGCARPLPRISPTDGFVS